jgi:hypothetical protein
LIGAVQKLHVFGQHAVFMLRAGVDLHEAQDQSLQMRQWWQGLGCHRHHQRFQFGHMAGADLHQQAVFVGHVVVQRGLGHAAGGSHFQHRGGGVAAGGKQLRSGREYFVTLIVKTCGTRAGQCCYLKR